MAMTRREREARQGGGGVRARGGKQAANASAPGKTSDMAKLRQTIGACAAKVPELAEETARRDVWERLTGQRSLRDMTVAQLGKVLDYLHRDAGVPTTPARASGRTKLAQDGQSKFLRAMWIRLADRGVLRDRSERALVAWCARTVGLPEGTVTDLGLMSSTDKHRCIDSLKAWCQREGVPVHE